MNFVTRIPTHYNDGSPIDAAERQAILSDVVKVFGGYSLDGPGHGAWQDDDGTLYDEPSYVLTVHCERSQYSQARDVVIDIGRRLKQQAMYFEVRYFDGVEIIDIS